MQTAGRVTHGLAVGAAALAGLGVGVAALKSLVEESSRLAKNADKVGLLTDEFQRLQYGFGLAGVEAANFTTAMEQFNKRLTEAQTGTGNLKKILDANNVSLFDSNGNMKSVNQLLGEYADLIQNAGNSQNKLYLATEAFGRSGGDMVLALRNGAQGMADLAREADNAGGVIDEQLLRRAEQFDDDWSEVARRFETNMKRGILNVVDAFYGMDAAIDHVGDKLGELGNASIFDKLNKLLGTDTTGKFVPGVGIVYEPETSQEDQESVVAPGGFEIPTPTRRPQNTAIPTTPPKKTGGSRKSSYEQTLAGLELELLLLGKTAEQQREINALRQAGVTASSAGGQVILDTVGKINQQRLAEQALSEQMNSRLEQQRALGDSMEYLGNVGMSALDAWLDGADDAAQSLKRMGVQLAFLAAQGLLLGQGPLAGLFGSGLGLFGGGGGSQLAGAVSGGFAGLFATGGKIGANEWGITGEAGPELVSGPATVTPLSKAVGGALTVPGRAGTSTQNINIGVAVDDEGSLRAYVKSESRQVAAAAVKSYDSQSVRRMQKDRHYSANHRVF